MPHFEKSKDVMQITWTELEKHIVILKWNKINM